MKLNYTPQARMDLRELYDYIALHLNNPTAAQSIVSQLLKSAERLADQKNLGFSVAEKTGRKTDVRCLLSGNYGVFYKQIEGEIVVVRFLDLRTDYMHILLQ